MCRSRIKSAPYHKLVVTKKGQAMKSFISEWVYVILAVVGVVALGVTQVVMAINAMGGFA